MKGDERILGDGDFVETVLKEAREDLEHKFTLDAKGFCSVMSRIKFVRMVCVLLAIFCPVANITAAAPGQFTAKVFTENSTPGFDHFATDAQPVFSDQNKRPSTRLETTDYPINPTGDIPWSAGFSGVTDIESAFNDARSIENTQLGTFIPMLSFPSQAEWDGKNDGEKALWLINRERIDRGIDPLHGIETNVTSVAQYYAQYLFANDTFGHYADGYSPWERLNNNSAIGDCHDFLDVTENVAYFVASGAGIPLPVERSVYTWMYTDSVSNWGHRHAILWFPYNDNSGTSGMEGFLGIGRANGGPYQGPFDSPWNYAEIIVMNVFDPCSTWDYGSSPEIPASISYPLNDPDGSYTVSWSAVSEATGYQLQRTTNSSFLGATTLYDGISQSYSESGLSNGTYYYRVRAYNDIGSSDWKTGQAIKVGYTPMPWMPLLLLDE